MPLTLVVLISGRGSNLKAILDAIDQGSLAATVSAVISSKADAPGLEYARQHHIDTLALDGNDYPERSKFDIALQGLIDQFNPELVVLAGFMRILSPGFVQHFQGHLINIHPSLLPEFCGLNTHQRVIDAGRTEHGASVHFVTEELDGGPLIAQVRIPVEAGETADQLESRVLEQEHQLYPTVINWIAGNRLQWNNGQILFDGEPLEEPLMSETV